MWQWWQYALLWAGSSTVGYFIGWGIKTVYGTRLNVRYAVRHVRPKCLRLGHKWLRLDGVPFQFCQRWRCDGARVSPYMVEEAPAEMIRDMELVIDMKGGALSQDRTP